MVAFVVCLAVRLRQLSATSHDFLVPDNISEPGEEDEPQIEVNKSVVVE
jgi:hypothetical protein